VSTSRIWKIIAGLAALFILGGVCGASLARKGRAPHAAATDRWSERWFEQMGGKLELRDEQRDQLRPMVSQLQQQLRDLQKETAARTSEIIRQNGKQMWNLLDETQRAKYRALQDEQKLHHAATTQKL
jgi:Spy/CpxP family protein refolding chaperone